MTRLVLLVSLVLACSCSSLESQKVDSELEQFNSFLGLQKVEALDLAVDSFNKFLKRNYRSSSDYNQRVISFIQDLYDNDFHPLKHWNIDTTEIREILNRFENSELRKDFYRFGYEPSDYNHEVIKIYDYVLDSIMNQNNYPKLGELADIDLEEEIIPIIRDSVVLSDSIIELERIQDSIDDANSLYTAEYNTFYAGLYKFAKADTLIQDIAFSYILAGDVSPSLKAEAYLTNKDDIDFSNPFIQRIIVTDFYWTFVSRRLYENS
jgi:hypothetical protein